MKAYKVYIQVAKGVADPEEGFVPDLPPVDKYVAILIDGDQFERLSEAELAKRFAEPAFAALRKAMQEAAGAG